MIDEDFAALKLLHETCKEHGLNWYIEYSEASDQFELTAEEPARSIRAYVKKAHHLRDGVSYLLREIEETAGMKVRP